ncbi:Tas protein [Simian foamy virus Pongo pygmaeus pygmaeus]|uniref:Tas protein n=1 Tax=Simian foamy virus Pongo pygmaeus pygmaeus TaxID=221703 RepID=Q7SIS4_9RETR|nr:Tas protein [Simian foamy virus Pongo pygmaeus pygmaeus]CAD67564.1 Tas protein [Simian foamy virus Pongo pygmaeus pygmaeus]
MDPNQEEEPVAGTSGMNQDPVPFIPEGIAAANESDDEEPEQFLYKVYQESVKKNGGDYPKLEDWIPSPEEMSKSVCISLILTCLYNAEKAAQIKDWGYIVHWEQSPTDSKYFLIKYECPMCDSINQEPMPIWWDDRLKLWRKMGCRAVMGSIVYALKNHVDKCNSQVHPLRKTGNRRPRPRIDPIRRCNRLTGNYVPGRRGSTKPSNPSSHPSSGIPLAPGPRQCSTNTSNPPESLLRLLPGNDAISPALAISMSGGQIWEEVYNDLLLDATLGTSDN